MMYPALCVVDCRKVRSRRRLARRHPRAVYCGELFARPSGRKRADDAVKGLMRKIVLALVVAVLPTWAAIAQQADQPRQSSPKSRTLHPAVRGNPCAQYGPGFVKVAGSGMCVKIGGSISIDAGGSARR